MTQAENEKPAAPVRTGTTGNNQGRPQSNRSAMDCKSDLPDFLKVMISCPPQRGEGMHQWLFNVSRHLHCRMDSEEIVALLSAVTQGCGSIPQREIVAAVESARDCAWKPNGSTAPTSKPPPKWPAVDQAKRQAAIAAAGMTVADLWHASPVTMGELDAEWYVDELFPNNPLLCCGLDKAKFRTAPREDFRGRLAELALIVPSPMSSPTGARKVDGSQSAHTLANTGPRRYLITEFDSGPPDEQAGIIWHLRQFAPLAMVLSSGGKSLHGWWDCRCVDEAIAGRFFRYACTLGADPVTWTRSQFVRMPGGWRGDKERRQDVLWCDLEAIRKGTVQ